MRARVCTVLCVCAGACMHMCSCHVCAHMLVYMCVCACVYVRACAECVCGMRLSTCAVLLLHEPKHIQFNAAAYSMMQSHACSLTAFSV